VVAGLRPTGPGLTTQPAMALTHSGLFGQFIASDQPGGLR